MIIKVGDFQLISQCAKTFHRHIKIQSLSYLSTPISIDQKDLSLLKKLNALKRWSPTFLASEACVPMRI